MKLKYHKKLFVLYLDSEVPGDTIDKKKKKKKKKKQIFLTYCKK